MAGKARHYFAAGNTAAGAYNLYESAFQGVRTLFILTGGPGTGKSTTISRIAGLALERGCDVEMFHCPSDSGSLDGLILTALRIGIVDGEACRLAPAEIPGARVHFVDVGRAVDKDKLAADKDRIIELERRIREAYGKAYETFAKALKIHDEWEAYYISSMRFDDANELTRELIESLFGARALNKKSRVRHLFLGAATPAGAVDFIPNLTEDTERRIFLKGRPGSGKSTLLKKICSAAEARGFDAEVFHCGFDPNSLDMLIFPELKTAIFDSTAPHEHDPSKETDEIVDLYERAMTPGTDEKYAEPIAEVRAKYKETMRLATNRLAEARSLYEQLKRVHISATDYAVVESIYGRLREEIEERIRLSGDC
jgi:hypothetical protein